MAQFDNPASRLHEILSRGKKVPATITIGDAWSRILGVDRAGQPALFIKLAGVMSLPDDIERRVLTIENVPHEMLLRWKVSVTNAFSILNFDRQWSEFISKIDEATLLGLEYCGDTLSRYNAEHSLTAKQLDLILADVRELQNMVQEAVIPGDLRSFILRHISDIESAIGNYEIYGIARIETEFHGAVGALAVNPERRRMCTEHPAGIKFWEMLQRIGLILQLVSTPLQIAKDLPLHLLQQSESAAIDQILDLPAAPLS